MLSQVRSALLDMLQWLADFCDDRRWVRPENAIYRLMWRIDPGDDLH